jgi:hypothetical protein
MKRKIDQPSAATVTAVRQLIKNVSAASVKIWLKAQELSSSAGTRDQLEQKVAGLIDAGELPLPKLRLAVIGIEESGGKRVHLFEVSAEHTNADIVAILKKASIKTSPSREFAASSSKTTLVYTQLSAHEIRMKWSEDHQKPEMDLTTMTVKLNPVKKVVVLRYHFGAKRAEISYDHPEAKHPHGATKGASAPASYYEYYRNLVEQLFGITLEKSELRGVLKQLIEETPPVATVKVQDHTNQQGNKVRVSARKNNVRDCKDWQAMYAKNGQEWAYDSHSFYWIASASNGSIKRDLFSALDADESFVRVPSDCNEEEINYALEQIRSRQAKVSASSQATG